MPKITVLTTVYNKEKYIERCICSVLSQSFTDFEYILIDNGSTDNSRDIILKYSAQDNRIRVIIKDVNTVGFWPELLRKEARGEYLTLIDGDDYVEVNYLEELLNFSVKNSLDISICGSYMINETTGEKTILRRVNADILLNKNDINMYFSQIHSFLRTTWGKLFTMSIIRQTDMAMYYKILEIAKYGGDTALVMEVLKKCNKIGALNKILHNYMLNNKSASYNIDSGRNAANQLLYQQANDFLSQFGEISRLNYIFINAVYANSVIDEINLIVNSSDMKVADKLQFIKKLFLVPLTKQAFMAVKNDNMGKQIAEYKRTLANSLINMAHNYIKNKYVQSLICSCIVAMNEGLKFYVTAKNFDKCLKYSDFIIQNINSDENELFINTIDALNKQNGYLLWPGLKSTMSENKYLQQVDSKKFVICYANIIKYVLADNLDLALDAMTKALTNGDDVLYEEELLKIYSSVSYNVGDTVLYIYARKLQTQLYIMKKDFKTAQKYLNELIDICPDDEDVDNLKEWLEEEHGK